MNGEAGIRGKLDALGSARDVAIQPRDEAAQEVWMDRADHRIFREILGAIGGAHSGRAAVFHDHCFNRSVVANFSAMILNAADQRSGQRAAAADSHAYAVLLHESKEDEDADAGPFFLGAR